VTVSYETNKPINPVLFIDILNRSTLGERRPVEDLNCMRGMIENSNLLITAWDSEKLVGISRSITDFHYACYLSDLAVDVDYQKQGIGKKMIELTRDALGPKCKLILLAAPAARDYYRHIGFTHHPRCWILERNQEIF
jgi:ribosomal protein S18 acetylase RimI-like enzyme